MNEQPQRTLCCFLFHFFHHSLLTTAISNLNSHNDFLVIGHDPDIHHQSHIAIHVHLQICLDIFIFVSEDMYAVAMRVGFIIWAHGVV